jgi:putative ABC transport system permease protein
MTTIFNDIKYGCRMLTKKPGFTVIAVLTLALGIGSNIAIFSLVNTYLLRPFPYDDAERLVDFTEMHTTFGRMSIAYPNFLDWQRENKTFEEMACYRGGSYNLTGVDIPERIRNMQVSSNFLPMLGVSPVAGRLFEQADDRTEAEPTVIISQGFWQRRFEGKSEAIGQSLILDDEAYTVIGVLPSSFSFPPILGDPIDVWTPIGLMTQYEWFMRRYNHLGTGGIGKLKEGVTLSQARDDLIRVAAQLEKTYSSNAGCSVVSSGFHERITGDIRPTLLVLMCAVVFVLLIVCVNIANLLLVRSTDRIQEFSIRSALGAGRLRIIRQLLCENLMLVILGGAFGIVVAKWGYHILCAQLPEFMRQNTETVFHIDVSLTLFILAVTLGSGLVFGLFPAWRSSKVNVSTTMRDSGRTTTAGLGHSRLRDILVVSEIALAFVLLVGAGLMLRSFIHYMQADPGYNPDSTLTVSVSLPDSRYPSDEQKYTFYEEFLGQVKSMPSVKHAGVTSNMLGGWQSVYYVEGASIPEPDQSPYAELNRASPDFFKAMGVRLLEGRFFTEHDTSDAPPVVVADEKFARKWWPNESPVGKRVQIHNSRPDPNGTWYEVVGLVSHIKHYGVDRDSRESLYLSAYQRSFDNVTLVVRTQGDPMQLVDPIRKAVLQLDPDLPVSSIQTLQAIVAERSLIRCLTTKVLGLFALTALLLSVLGIYGVIAYSVSKRTNEIGIRMAMGAGVGDILRLVVRHGGKLVLIGTGIGLAGTFAVTRLMSSFLFEVTARDPITFLLVIIMLGGASLLACYIPARRAAKIHPMEALRYE